MPQKRFYVYTLAEHDRVFYVGKGTRARLLKHEAEAMMCCPCPKCETIRAIWAAGEEVQRSIVFETDDETEAFLREAEMILLYGLSGLTNIKPGRTTRDQQLVREVKSKKRRAVGTGTVTYDKAKQCWRAGLYAGDPWPKFKRVWIFGDSKEAVVRVLRELRDIKATYGHIPERYFPKGKVTT